MIDAKQIRAARALLNMSQKQVSEGAGLGMNTLSGIESGDTVPSSESLSKLERFFLGCGLEFMDGGVRESAADKVYKGEFGMRQFFNAVYEVARHGGEIAIFNGVPSLLLKWAGEEFYTMHAKRMEAIKSRMSVRVIIKEGDENLIGASFAAYKTIDADKFHDKTFYIFGEFVAFFDFGDDLSIRVLKDKDLAESMLVLFDYAWN